MTCPLCRTVSDGCDLPDAQPEVCRSVTIPLAGDGTYAGVTLSNKELCEEEEAVLTVVGLHRRDRAFSSGLRKGDAICSINGFSGLHHPQAVELINAATKRGGKLVVGVSNSVRGRNRHLKGEVAPERPRSRSLPASWGSALLFVPVRPDEH